MSLPLLISVPHAGLTIPPEAQPYCILTPEQIAKDGDEGAAEIYAIEDEVTQFVSTQIARAILDMNRALDDRRNDGVVKTHTCWDEAVYEPTPPESVFEVLFDKYYKPYHKQLTDLAAKNLLLAIDCHTMASHGPPIGPDPGKERPAVCLSNADGTCTDDVMQLLAACFRDTFNLPIAVNEPFQGGFITRSHSVEMPWVQLELTRALNMSNAEKRDRVLRALKLFCSSTCE